mgnify:CR=1 FL=1
MNLYLNINNEQMFYIPLYKQQNVSIINFILFYFDNIVKSKKVSKPKLSPSQRSSLSFDSAKCHARCIAIASDEQGNPLYRKKGNVHPGLIDFQCSASHKEGHFCAKHSAACGGGGNLGSFDGPRPETIEGYGGEKFEGHIWLWADDPQSDQYKITEKSSKKNLAKKALSKSSISYDDQEWSDIIQDTKMKKDPSDPDAAEIVVLLML